MDARLAHEVAAALRLSVRTAADRIAHELGLNQRHAFTTKQYRLFITGQGVGGKLAAAKLVDASVRILTNTTGTPLFAKVNGIVRFQNKGQQGRFVNVDPAELTSVPV